VLDNGHAGFGRRPGETHQWQHRQGAPGRHHRAEGKTHTQAIIALAAAPQRPVGDAARPRCLPTRNHYCGGLTTSLRISLRVAAKLHPA
jgi:hypothetical protein